MRPIDADHLMESVKGGLVEGADGSYMFQRFVDEEPTIDPVKHGHWIDVKGEDYYGEHYWYYKCSKCRSSTGTLFKYCPYCGAKMDEVTN